MSEDKQGRMTFLVKKFSGGKEFFPATEIIEQCTALASVIEKLKIVTKVSIDQIELMELTNTIYKTRRIPLYVFKYTGDIDQLEMDDSFKWSYFEDLKETFEECLVDGVPLLSELTSEVI